MAKQDEAGHADTWQNFGLMASTKMGWGSRGNHLAPTTAATRRVQNRLRLKQEQDRRPFFRNEGIALPNPALSIGMPTGRANLQSHAATEHWRGTGVIEG